MCIPTFTKCCFCFPLRKGVLCYGYIHLVLCSLCTATAYMISGLQTPPAIQIVATICVVLFIAEALILITLIVACHKRNIGLLKTPLVYNKVWWVFYVVLGVIITIRMVFMYNEEIATNNALLLAILFDIGLCNICLRSYVILWIKGLMVELKERSPSSDIASDKFHILEVAVEENEEIVEIETNENIDHKEDKNNTKNGVELQINEDEVEIIGNDDTSNANLIEVVHTLPKENEQDIELQVFN